MAEEPIVDLSATQSLPDNNPKNQLSQNDLPQQKQFDMNTLALLLGLLQQVNKEKGDKAKPKDFIEILESVIENTKEI